MNPHRARKPTDEFDDSPIKYPSQLPPTNDGKSPNVMIVGAGLGGLLLAILLDKAGIPYEIYERASSVKSLGSIMALQSNIMAALEQLGLLEELEAISFPAERATIMYDNMKIIAEFSNPNHEGEDGYRPLHLSRPDLYQLLLSKVPAEKIHYNKRVTSLVQNKEGVMVRCADGTTYHGDILVGADGAHSGVRQALFSNLMKQNLLPSSDATELSKGFLAMVGTTDPMDPEKYPFVKNKKASRFNQVIGRGTSYNWSEFNVPDNRVCWLVISQVSSISEFEKMKFRNSEWGPESNPEFTEQVKDFKLPGCGTVGNLLDATPAANISRVFLEEKLFETWSHGRTVLIGDAAHKLLPSAGQGAVCALEDAVILANCLYDLESLDRDVIHAACLDYKAQRFHRVAEMYDKSKVNATILYGQTVKERIIRHVALKWVPDSIKRKEVNKGAAYRPTIAFLPPVPKRGSLHIHPQKPSKRYEREQKKRKEEEETLKKQNAVEGASSTATTPVVAI